MAVNVNWKVSYVPVRVRGDGLRTNYSPNFPCLEVGHLRIYSNNVDITAAQGTQFNISLPSRGSIPTITFNTAPPSSDEIFVTLENVPTNASVRNLTSAAYNSTAVEELHEIENCAIAVGDWHIANGPGNESVEWAFYKQHVALDPAGLSESQRVPNLSIYPINENDAQRATRIAARRQKGDPVNGADLLVVPFMPKTLSVGPVRPDLFFTNISGSFNFNLTAFTGISCWLRTTHFINEIPGVPANVPNIVSYRRFFARSVVGSNSIGLPNFGSETPISSSSEGAALINQRVNIQVDLVFQCSMPNDSESPLPDNSNLPSMESIVFHRPSMTFIQFNDNVGRPGTPGIGVPTGASEGQAVVADVAGIYQNRNRIIDWNGTDSHSGFIRGDIIRYLLGTQVTYLLVNATIAANVRFENTNTGDTIRIDGGGAGGGGGLSVQQAAAIVANSMKEGVPTANRQPGNVLTQSTGDDAGLHWRPRILSWNGTDTTLGVVFPGDIIKHTTPTPPQYYIISNDGTVNTANANLAGMIAGDRAIRIDGGGTATGITPEQQAAITANTAKERIIIDVDMPDPRLDSVPTGSIFVSIGGSTVTWGSNTYNNVEGQIYEKFGTGTTAHWSDTSLDLRKYFRGEWVNVGGYHIFAVVSHNNRLYMARAQIGTNTEPGTNANWVELVGRAALMQSNTFPAVRNITQNNTGVVGYLYIGGGTAPYTISNPSAGVGITGSGNVRLITYSAGISETIGQANKTFTITDAANNSITVTFAVNVVEGFAERATWNVGTTTSAGNAFFDGAGTSTTSYSDQVTWNVGLASGAQNAEWDDDGTGTPATYGNEVSFTGNSENTLFGSNPANGGVASSLRIIINSITGTLPSTSVGTIANQIWRLRHTALNGTVTEVLGAYTVTNSSATQVIIRIGSQAQMAAFGAANIEAGSWVLDRQLTVEVPTANPNNALCYNATTLSGTVPAASPTQLYRITLQGSSNIRNNNSVIGLWVVGNTPGCFVIGSVEQMRLAFGSGADIATGGGRWVVESVTTTQTQAPQNRLITNAATKTGAFPTGTEGKTFRLVLEGNTNYPNAQIQGSFDPVGTLGFAINNTAAMAALFGPNDIDNGGGEWRLLEQTGEADLLEVVQSTVQSDASLKGSGAADSLLGVADGGIQTVHIGDDQVVTAKIPDGGITTPKIGDDQVVTAKIPDGGITTPKIGDGQVVNAKIADVTIGLGKIDRTGGTAGQVPTINTAGNGLEWGDGGSGGVSAVDDATIEIFTDVNDNNTMKLRLKDAAGTTAGITTAKIQDDAVTEDKVSQALLDRIPPLPAA